MGECIELWDRPWVRPPEDTPPHMYKYSYIEEVDSVTSLACVEGADTLDLRGEPEAVITDRGVR